MEFISYSNQYLSCNIFLRIINRFIKFYFSRFIMDGKLLFLVPNDDNMLSSTFPENFLSADC